MAEGSSAPGATSQIADIERFARCEFREDERDLLFDHVQELICAALAPGLEKSWPAASEFTQLGRRLLTIRTQLFKGLDKIEALAVDAGADVAPLKWLREFVNGDVPRHTEKAWAAAAAFETIYEAVLKYPCESLRVCGNESELPKTSPPKCPPQGRTDGAHAAVRAHAERLFPKGVPDDPDLRDVVLKLNSERGSDNSDIDIIRKHFGETAGNDPRSKSMQGKIRALRGRGGTTLPKRG